MKQEILSALSKWVTDHGGSMPSEARLDRASWLRLLPPDSVLAGLLGFSERWIEAPVTSVRNGHTVIWLFGIPLKEDPTLGANTVEFEP